MAIIYLDESSVVTRITDAIDGFGESTTTVYSEKTCSQLCQEVVDLVGTNGIGMASIEKVKYVDGTFVIKK